MYNKICFLNDDVILYVWKIPIVWRNKIHSIYNRHRHIYTHRVIPKLMSIAVPLGLHFISHTHFQLYRFQRGFRTSSTARIGQDIDSFMTVLATSLYNWVQNISWYCKKNQFSSKSMYLGLMEKAPNNSFFLIFLMYFYTG